MNYTAMTDEELLLLYYQGDDEAFDHLTLRYYPPSVERTLFAYACILARRTRDPDDLAWEIFQTTFASVIETRETGRNRWRAGCGTVEAWMRTILYHEFVDEMRRRGVRVVEELPPEGTEAPGFGPCRHLREHVDFLRQCHGGRWLGPVTFLHTPSLLRGDPDAGKQTGE